MDLKLVVNQTQADKIPQGRRQQSAREEQGVDKTEREAGVQSSTQPLIRAWGVVRNKLGKTRTFIKLSKEPSFIYLIISNLTSRN